MTMNWRNPGMEYLNGQNIYDFGLNNPTGLNTNGNWTPADLSHLQNVNWQRPDTSQQPSPAAIQNYLNNEATMREVFGLFGNSSGFGGGAMPNGDQAFMDSMGRPGGTGSSQGFSLFGNGGGAGASAGAAGGATAAATQPAWYSNPQLWGALLGGVGSYLDSRSQNAANGRPITGTTDMYSQNSPWGPSDPYRQAAMQQAFALLNGQGGGGGGRGGRGGRGGGGGGGGGFGNSQALANAMSQYAMGSDPLLQQGREYMSNALNDPYGGSSLLGRTFEAANGLSDADLNQFISNMMGDWGGGGGGGGTTNNPFGAFRSAGGASAAGGGGAGLIGMDQYIEDMLNGSYEDNANPQLQALIAQMNQGITDAYQQGLAGLSGAGNAAGAGNTSAYQLADAQAAGNFARALTENATSLTYSDYERYRDEIMQAMGLGTQYDLGMADVNARNRATAASSRSASEANALQRELGNRGLLLDALGLRQGYAGMGLDTMAGLSNIDVANRQFMLGAIPQYHEIPMQDMATAFEANFGLDRTQAQMRNEAAARAQANARYQQNLPWQRLAQFMDIINGASNGYGTEHRYGTETQQGGGQQNSPWGQALLGALGGAQLGQNLYSSYNRG